MLFLGSYILIFCESIGDFPVTTVASVKLRTRNQILNFELPVQDCFNDFSVQHRRYQNSQVVEKIQVGVERGWNRYSKLSSPDEPYTST